MELPLIQILAMLFLSLVILGLCYILIKKTLKSELEKSLPNQLKAVRDLFGEKEVELTVFIDKEGKVKIQGFDIKEKIDYAH